MVAAEKIEAAAMVAAEETEAAARKLVVAEATAVDMEGAAAMRATPAV